MSFGEYPSQHIVALAVFAAGDRAGPTPAAKIAGATEHKGIGEKAR